MSKTRRKATTTTTKAKMETRYAWTPGARTGGVNAQTAGEELARITSAAGGELRPRIVVEESRPDEAPLHPCFEWDDERAADLYRDEQARSLIRSVRVVSAGSDGDVPPETRIQYVAVQVAEHEPRVYVETARAVADPDLRRQVLAEAISTLRGFRRRYQELKELASVFDAIDSLPNDNDAA